MMAHEFRLIVWWSEGFSITLDCDRPIGKISLEKTISSEFSTDRKPK